MKEELPWEFLGATVGKGAEDSQLESKEGAHWGAEDQAQQGSPALPQPRGWDQSS